MAVRVPALFALAVFSAAVALAAPLCAGEPSSGEIRDALLRRMIGQMVLVGFVGDSPDSEGSKTAMRHARDGMITGVLHLARNIRSQGGVKLLNEELQRSSAFPLLIAVDQEGGRIERLTASIGFGEIPSASEVARTMSPEAARKLYERLAADLGELGFNVNLAPVVDLNVNASNPVIGKLGRSYSANPDTVIAYARSFVRGHRSKGVLTSLKHFPGHGSSAKDSHKGAADVSQTWREEELLPYSALIKSGDVDMIMSSHVINGKLSPDMAPSSLSRDVLEGLLRATLGFKGVVLSDDLQMGAVADAAEFQGAVLRAVLAGNDILVFANDRHPDPLIPEKVAALLSFEAKRDPRIMARIRESYANVMRLKSKLTASVPAIQRSGGMTGMGRLR